MITPKGVGDAAAGRLVLAPGGWASVYRTQLTPDTVAEGRSWQSSEFVNGRLPTALDGVNITIGSKAAAVAYVSNGQVNFLVPTDVMPGSMVPLLIKTLKGTSSTVTTSVQEYAPNLYNTGRFRRMNGQAYQIRFAAFATHPPQACEEGVVCKERLGRLLRYYCRDA